VLPAEAEGGWGLAAAGMAVMLPGRTTRGSPAGARLVCGPRSACADLCHVAVWAGEADSLLDPFRKASSLSPPVPPGDAMNEVTCILSAIEQGDPHAAAQLLPLVYVELRRLAVQKLSQEKPGQTLQATALVHEAYLRLVDVKQPQCWNSRGHFFAAAAEAMRRILVENARRKQAEKHGGQARRVAMETAEPTAPERDEKLLALDGALARLEQHDPTKAQLVKLRWFAGLTIQETADLLGLSTATANRYWAYARAWLQREMQATAGEPR
jgi:RNA polymerase sigma factor (TIGR02999 family)